MKNQSCVISTAFEFIEFKDNHLWICNIGKVLIGAENVWSKVHLFKETKKSKIDLGFTQTI